MNYCRRKIGNDRRNGDSSVRSIGGARLELERPRRVVFTLRVPKYSPDEDRVIIEIKPLASGCEPRCRRAPHNGAALLEVPVARRLLRPI
jgi:hypothetical protein